MRDYDPTVRTRTLARIIGPYLVATAVALSVRGDTVPELLLAFMQDGPLVFVAGAFTLMAGLVVLAAHHHWSSVNAAMISFVGVAAALKGASLMIAPGFGAELTDAVVRTPTILQAAIWFELLLGLWLCFVGWLREAFVFAFALNR
jgi:hypothetical protein